MPPELQPVMLEPRGHVEGEEYVAWALERAGEVMGRLLPGPVIAEERAAGQ